MAIFIHCTCQVIYVLLQFSLSAGKEATSKLHLSRGDMYKILSQASLVSQLKMSMIKIVFLFYSSLKMKNNL